MLYFIFALVGGWISRMMGGGRPTFLPLPAQWLYAAPYGLIFTGSLWGILAYIAAAIGARTAHYPYFLMGQDPVIDTTRVPPVDFLIRPFFGAISPTGGQYWRCVAGLSATGLACTILSGFLYACAVNPLSGAIIAGSGLLNPVGYMIGVFLRRRGIYSQDNVVGEFMRGFTGWGVLACLLF